MDVLRLTLTYWRNRGNRIPTAQPMYKSSIELPKAQPIFLSPDFANTHVSGIISTIFCYCLFRLRMGEVFI